MSSLQQIIKPLEGFQYSVNIAYDIYDDKKIKSYIPSSSSLQIIEELLHSTESKSTDRARILTGSYGKGKSHLILYTLALLAGRDASLFSMAVKKAQEINPNLAQNIEAYLKSNKKLLPVIVNANSMDIKSTLLQSLSLALGQAGLDDIMPTTFFDVAVDKINIWKKDFQETYHLFERKVGETGATFIRQLKDYNQSYYDLFIKVYPSLTSGSEFNPLAGADVISVYESVIEAIKSKGYNGIFVVYDEFGKFLEGSVEKYSAMDIKIIQDFAEKCNRSGANQLHIMLISHKGIDNYIGRLSKIKVDAWKAVSKRFKAITIENSEAELFDIVFTVLARDERLYHNFRIDHSKEFDWLWELVQKDHAFSGVIQYGNLAEKCYPLHPYTLLILPKVSELVAQNERTIFTFLSSTERYTVPYFLRMENSDFPLIEPDYIYDYFESLFKGEPYGSNIKKQWQIATSALSKLREQDNPLAEKIVKTITLIYCISDFEVLPPSWDIICDIYATHYTWAEIESAKQVLKNCHLLIELLYKPHVRLTEGSNHNALEMIQQEKYRIEHGFAPNIVFERLSNTKYLYPVQYNDENEIIRYFEFRFVNCADLEFISKYGMELDTDADGIVFAVLVGSEQDLALAKERISAIHNQRAVFILPNETYSYSDLAQEYNAVENLIEIYAGKEIELVDELMYILEDRHNVLNAYIENTYFRFDKKLATVFYQGEVRHIARKAHLPQLLSEIATQIYNRTPKVVNELINRNELSGAIKNARSKILSALLSVTIVKDLGLQGNGPELNVMRSMLIIPGILINDDNPRLEYNCNDIRFRSILQIIKTHILDSSQNDRLNLGNLYDTLIKPEYGYGLKKGIIPIFLAIAFTQYKDHIVVKRKNREYAPSAALLADIEFSPRDFKVVLEQWDEDKDSYIAGLENIFAQYISASDRAGGIFAYIVKAMRRWYLQLTKFEVTTKIVCEDNGAISSMDTSALKYRNALSNSEINAHEFLFKQLPNIFGATTLSDTLVRVRIAHQKITTTYRNLHIKFINEIKILFGAKEEESLTSTIANFYDDLKSTTKEHLFSGKIGMFLDIAKHPNNDAFKLIEAIARALFNLRMGDFNDEIMNCFMDGVKSVREDILAYNSGSDSINSTFGSFKIVFSDESGNETTRQFDATQDSQEGQLLYNDLTSAIEEYGEAISSEEKRQILFRILKELV
jgi:hypothetical protein